MGADARSLSRSTLPRERFSFLTRLTAGGQRGLMSPRLLSVNAGIPQDIHWHGETVHTGIWKEPVEGRRMARRRRSWQFQGSRNPSKQYPRPLGT